MLNQIILVGRLVKDIENDRLTLAVPRPFKNAEGIYETDFIDVQMFGTIATNTAEYCRKGDLIGVKGRLESIKEDDGDGHIFYKQHVVAEKITFLSSQKQNNDNA